MPTVGGTVGAVLNKLPWVTTSTTPHKPEKQRHTNKKNNATQTRKTTPHKQQKQRHTNNKNNKTSVSKCSLYTFYSNPAPVRSMQFHYCTVSNPGTGADDAFVLKRCVLRNATWPSHSRPAIAAGARHFQLCFRPKNFDHLCVYLLFVYLVLFIHQDMCTIIWHLLDLRMSIQRLFRRRIESMPL